MAEGARLESVFTGNRNEGSNPSLTATQTAKLSLKSPIEANARILRRLSKGPVARFDPVPL